MSGCQTSFGAVASKPCPGRFSATGKSWFDGVVALKVRCCWQQIPSSRHKRARRSRRVSLTNQECPFLSGYLLRQSRHTGRSERTLLRYQLAGIALAVVLGISAPDNPFSLPMAYVHHGGGGGGGGKGGNKPRQGSDDGYGKGGRGVEGMNS